MVLPKLSPPADTSLAWRIPDRWLIGRSAFAAQKYIEALVVTEEPSAALTLTLVVRVEPYTEVVQDIGSFRPLVAVSSIDLHIAVDIVGI